MNRKTMLSLLVVVFVASFVSACGSSHKAALAHYRSTRACSSGVVGSQHFHSAVRSDS